MNKFLVLFLLIFGSLFSENSYEIEDLLDLDEENNSEILVQFEKYEVKPLNINFASKNELQSLLILTKVDIKKILKYRNKNLITSYRSLKKIGIEEEKINFLKDYICFKSSKANFLRNRIRYLKTGEDDFKNYDFYTKTRLDYKNFQFGFLSQKDKYEKSVIDFYSVYGEYNNPEMILEKAVLGKYYLSFGQGILLANKLQFKKSLIPNSNISNKKIISPYTSSYEAWNFHGFSAKIGIKNLKFFGFGSKNKLSANLENNKITSFNETGLNKNNNVNETFFGGIINYETEKLNFGFLLMNNKFSQKFEDPVYSDNYSAYSFNFSYENDFMNPFLEISSASRKKALELGLKWGDEVEQVLIFRDYEKNFPIWHGKPFSAQGNNFDNELGVFYNLRFSINNLKFFFYTDIWKQPKLRYLEDMPTSGFDQKLKIITMLDSGKIIFSFSRKDREKYRNLAENPKIYDNKEYSAKIDIYQELNKFLLIKNHFEYKIEEIPEAYFVNNGFLMYQQLQYKIRKYQIYLRATTFDSEELHYVYENSISTMMENSIFSGNGLSFFFLLKYNLNENLEIQTKYKYDDSKNKIYLLIESLFF